MIDEILVSFLIIFFYLRFRLIMNFQIVDFNQIFSQSDLDFNKNYFQYFRSQNQNLVEKKSKQSMEYFLL